MLRVLVVEDDPSILEVISFALRIGWPDATVTRTHLGAEGIEMVETERPDIVLLALELPDMDGLDALSEIRSFSDVPLIIVSVRGGEMDRVRGLDLGADDYMVKPFRYIELVARVKAVLRRTSLGYGDLNRGLVRAGLALDVESHQVLLHGKEICLTPTEYRILWQLVSNAGQTVSGGAIIERVWGKEGLDTPGILKAHIYHLRRKLKESAGDPDMIVSVFGRGYRFDIPVPEATPRQLSLPI